MTDPDQSDAARRLAEVLLENNMISQAQIDLAIADQEINDIPLEEILIVRGWLTEDKLHQVAPWLKPGSLQPAPAVTSRTGTFAKPGGGKSGSFAKPDLSSGASGAGKTGSFAKPDLSQAKAQEPVKQAEVAAAEQGSRAKPAETTLQSAAAGSSSAGPLAEKEPADKVEPVKSEGESTTPAGDASKSSQDKAKTEESKESEPAGAGTAGGGSGEKSGGAGAETAVEAAVEAGKPAPVFESPVKSDSEKNLRAYKDVLKKILAVERD